MIKPRVYVTREIAPEALDMISKVAEMEIWKSELVIPRETLLGKINDIDGLILGG